MNRGINLAKGNKNGQLEKQKKILKIVRIVSALSLVVVVFLSLAFFIVSLTSPINSLEKEESALASSILTYKSKAVKLLLIQNRVKELSGVLSSKSQFSKTIDSLISAIPSDIIVEGLTVDKKNISLTLKSDSLYSINLLIDNLSEMIGDKKPISKITLKNLIVDPNLGVYSVSLALELL